MDISDNQSFDHRIIWSYNRCRDWSFDRIERWANIFDKADDLDATCGYLTALALRLALARRVDALQRVIDERLVPTFEKLQVKDRKFLLPILNDALHALVVKLPLNGDIRVLDAFTAVTLKVIDVSEGSDLADSFSRSMLHQIGNVYQSLSRVAELAEVRKRELDVFKPTTEKFREVNTNLYALWQNLVDGGQLDDARICLNDLFAQVLDSPNLGNLAFFDLLQDLTSIAFSQKKPERLDLLIDTALDYGWTERLDNEALARASKVLANVVGQLEQHEWWHDSIRLLKRTVALLLARCPTSTDLEPLLQKVVFLTSEHSEVAERRSYFKDLHDLIAEVDVSPEFKTLVSKQFLLSDQSMKLAESVEETLVTANAQANPEASVRALLQGGGRNLLRCDRVHRASLLNQLLAFYRQSPFVVDRVSVGYHCWNFAQSFMLHSPIDSAPFIDELTSASVERIRTGELVKTYSSCLISIQTHSKSRGVTLPLERIYSALAESSNVDNQLEGLHLRIKALDFTNEEKVSNLVQVVIDLAPKLSRIAVGDECLAIKLLVELARHLKAGVSTNRESEIDMLGSQSLKYFVDCSNEAHARSTIQQLWTFAELAQTSADKRREFALQLFSILESRPLLPNEESEVERSLFSFINRLTNTDRLAAEKALSGAIEIRESIKGQNSPRLVPLLYQRLYQFESAKRISECEVLKRRIDELKSDANPTDEQRLADQIENAIFYIRNELFAQAEALWKPILEKMNEPLSGQSFFSTARGMVGLADGYMRKERYGEVEDILVRTLPLLDEGWFAQADRVLNKLVKKYEERAHAHGLERLLLASINAPRRSASAANQSRLILCDLYLATGRPDQAQLMFEEVIQVAKLQGLDTRPFLHSRAASLRRHGFSADASELEPQKVHSVNAASFEFALFGVQEVSLSGNAEVGSYKSSLETRPSRGRRPGSGHVGSFGIVRLEGNARVMGAVLQPPVPEGNSHDTMAGQFSRHMHMKVELMNRSRLASNEGSVPVPILADFKVGAVPPTPASAISFDQQLMRLHEPPAGDYIMSETRGRWIFRRTSGRTRVFLTDDTSSGTVPFTFADRHQATGKPIDFQVWYNGTRDIVVGSMCATIYAPNATVRVGGNATFAGAILANRIICDGNACIAFDEDLFGMQL